MSIKDVTDFFEAGASEEDLVKLIELAEEFQPAPNGAGPGSPPDSTIAQPPSGLPEIYSRNRLLREITQENLAALREASHPPRLLVRGGQLVHVVSDERGRAVIRAVDFATLRRYSAEAANHFFENKDGDRRDCSPPKDLIENTLALDAVQWGFPPLEGISGLPIVRPDGRLATETGYDPVSRWWYQPAPELSDLDIPDRPAPAQIQAAAETLSEPFADFPFIDDASRAAILADLFTVAVRPSIPGSVPLHLIDAPAPGTGKTLALDQVAIITTGRSCPLSALPKDEEEIRKALTTSLREGPAIVAFDNVPESRPLYSDSLCRAITAEVYKDRLLGTNVSLEVPVSCIFVVTGNNIRVADDLRRRSYWTRLDAETSRPYERAGFRHLELSAWTKHHRLELVTALFTIIRGWRTAGDPEAKPRAPVMGGFEAWQRIIGGLLEFAGVAGFLENLEEFRQGDEHSDQWETFLVGVAGVFSSKDFLAIELSDELDRNFALQQLVPAELQKRKDDDNRARRIGNVFAHYVDRRFGESGVRIEKAPKGIHKSTCWRVVMDRPEEIWDLR
jgi:hypothetical protein